ncbi:unnamed protein product [Sphagnum troendelagicum]|uniref:Uncharacterized protein n=1 Tax=Sphagnum troendelagicum TaxID=128251 RepID=A0ABP0TYC0_9BRYO
MLLVRPVQSFIASLRGNNDAARQYMNLWTIQRDAAIDGKDVSRLVAMAFLEHANLDLGMADYRHLAAYFGGAIKKNHPSTGLAATTRGSNARSVSASSSSTGPRTLDLQGTGLGRDAGPRQYGRPVGGHAHRTRQVGHVHDPVDGDRLHRHRGGASNDPCPRTRSGRDSSRLTTRDLRRGHDHVRRPSVHRVRIGATRGHSEVRGTRAHVEPFAKASLHRGGEAHLLLSDFRPVMKRLLPLWAVGCQLVALTASLSPSEEMDLKIVMSTRFAVVWMSTVRPLIQYVVDEVADVDEEIVR